MNGTLTLSFSGTVCCCDLDEIMVVKTGAMKDISDVSSEDVQTNVDAGIWALSLKDCMANGENEDIEMFDIEIDPPCHEDGQDSDS